MFCGAGSGEECETLPGQPVAYATRRKPIDSAVGIPVRLTLRQRKLQRLMRGVVLASSYTDRVDSEEIFAKKKAHREMAIVKEVITALNGFSLALDLVSGAKLVAEGDLQKRSKEIIAAVELARRYKIMNPDLLRTDYVKFLYLVQDAVQNEQCRQALGFDVVSPIRTVKFEAERLHCEALLEDERLPLSITPVPAIKDRTKLNKALRFKDQTVNRLVKDHAASSGAAADDVEILVRSLNDANCFANDNVDSIDALIKLLKHFFQPDAPQTPLHNLSIREGDGGSRLSHEHARQYTFVLQSLALWRNISQNMFELWMLAEEDLLNPEQAYELRNTGQGLHRVQPAPKLYNAVSRILEETKRELGAWVGSEKIHMGDNQVPNAFYFIDKYAQISRIIVPVLRTIQFIEDLDNPSAAGYAKEQFGGPSEAQVAILADFFRHGFDGSGGDNMEDAGSCIDGRLTSAWNWCNQIKGKPYYPFFLLCGFSSFDGDLTL